MKGLFKVGLQRLLEKVVVLVGHGFSRAINNLESMRL
jgi:hypothetical protein